MSNSPMKPSDELRAAATLLRETARGATPGPWGVETVVKDSIGVYSYPGHQFVATLGSASGDSAVRHDAAWVALANPALAEPDAELLDVIAEFAVEYGIHEHVDGEACGDFACRIVVAALATARTINANRGAK